MFALLFFSGYIVPFYELPESKYCENNKSAIAHSDFVSKSIQELLQSGIVVKVDQIPHVVNPLTVSVNAKGKERLILDLRHVNQYVVKYEFNLEGIKGALDFVPKNGLMFKFDLSSGYHHIDLHASMYKYFGFSWDNCFYVFSSLPFGLSSAPFIFTKILRNLVRFWGEQGVYIIYLDDGFGFSDSFANCEYSSLKVYTTLIKTGFVVNTEKSVWIPQKCLEWLGFTWNMGEVCLELPSVKVEKLLFMINNIVDNDFWVTARYLAKITGKIVSFSENFGSVCRFMTRQLHLTICFRRS